MTPQELKEKVATLLLSELKQGLPAWFYLSVVTPEGFAGGYFIRAYGPTDAWRLLHALDWCPPDAETCTRGPLGDEDMERVPQDKRWCRLSKEEVISL